MLYQIIKLLLLFFIITFVIMCFIISKSEFAAGDAQNVSNVSQKGANVFWLCCGLHKTFVMIVSAEAHITNIL